MTWRLFHVHRQPLSIGCAQVGAGGIDSPGMHRLPDFGPHDLTSRADYWGSVRRLGRPHDEALTGTWQGSLRKLPPGRRPGHLSAQFSRLANLLAGSWRDPVLSHQLLGDCWRIDAVAERIFRRRSLLNCVGCGISSNALAIPSPSPCNAPWKRCGGSGQNTDPAPAAAAPSSAAPESAAPPPRHHRRVTTAASPPRHRRATAAPPPRHYLARSAFRESLTRDPPSSGPSAAVCRACRWRGAATRLRSRPISGI